MCGIAGVYDPHHQLTTTEALLETMTQAFANRGPDDEGYHVAPGLGFGFRRLAIIDLRNGNQPMFSADRSLVCICNGEIFNYKELRAELIAKGHRFETECDVEVLIPLYQEHGADFVKRLNGQFALALYDAGRERLLLARDQAGITPLFYTRVGDALIFSSVIKGLLEHPAVARDVDLVGLDQLAAFPAVISPRTMFRNIHALPAGHMLLADRHSTQTHTYWDLDYPREDAAPPDRGEAYYLEQLEAVLQESVRLRLQADVPVGCYLSGGLDSSLLAGLIHRHRPNHSLSTFSIGFTEAAIDERRYQQLVAQHIGARHHEVVFGADEIQKRMHDMIWHAESPLKECYDTCSLALSELVHQRNYKVVLAGEGADELFAGYAGYRFDAQRDHVLLDDDPLTEALERETNLHLWGDEDLFYETRFSELSETKQALFSAEVSEALLHDDALNSRPVDPAKLDGRHILHKRAYLDFKLRLGNHLLSDHGDRVGYANSVEVRYPFLDPHVIEFVRTLPPHYKFDGRLEKALLKKLAPRYVPQPVIEREKFGFVAPGSPYLLGRHIEWLEDVLSYERIKRQGYFNPDVVERLKSIYRAEGFMLQVPYETDLLMIVLTFGLFLDLFRMPDRR